MAKRYHGSYEDHDDVRRMEHADSGLIPHHGGAHANMPTELVMKPFPKEHDYLPENLDDTARGIDHQLNLDNSAKHKHLDPKKI